MVVGGRAFWFVNLYGAGTIDLGRHPDEFLHGVFFHVPRRAKRSAARTEVDAGLQPQSLRFPQRVLHQLPPPGTHEVDPARRRGHEGTVDLRIHVLASGRSDAVEIKRSSGHASLDRAAVRAAEKWRFEPASDRGRAVAMWIEIPVEFNLRETP